MLGAMIPPLQATGGGGSWTLAIVSLAALAVVTWVWIAGTRRQERLDRTKRLLPRPRYEKAA